MNLLPIFWTEVLNLYGKAEQLCNTSKIVGYMTVRNEATIIEQSVRCFFNFIDELVILDDASTDETLAILQRLVLEFPIQIICNTTSSRLTGRESDNHKKLLAAARQTGGAHFVCLDADEVFTSNCLINDYLRQEILKLKPGESIELPWITLWSTTYTYRVDHEYGGLTCTAIFCDTKGAQFNDVSLHNPRIPKLPGKVYKLPTNYGILHYSFCSQENHAIKRAWYRCLELVRGWDSVKSINRRYHLNWKAPHIAVAQIPAEWVSSYANFDPSCYELPVPWRKDQVLSWFKEYGKAFFKDLDIWEVNWDA